METKFKFNSQICTTREQSERLLALGLKKETADMALHFSYVDCEGNAYYIAYPIGHQCTAIPAWSLHRLIEMCNIVIRVLRHRVSLSSGKGFSTEETLYDNLIDCIEWLIKEGYFNKEYLV